MGKMLIFGVIEVYDIRFYVKFKFVKVVGLGILVLLLKQLLPCISAA